MFRGSLNSQHSEEAAAVIHQRLIYARGGSSHVFPVLITTTAK